MPIFHNIHTVFFHSVTFLLENCADKIDIHVSLLHVYIRTEVTPHVDFNQHVTGQFRESKIQADIFSLSFSIFKTKPQGATQRKLVAWFSHYRKSAQTWRPWLRPLTSASRQRWRQTVHILAARRRHRRQAVTETRQLTLRPIRQRTITAVVRMKGTYQTRVGKQIIFDASNLDVNNVLRRNLGLTHLLEVGYLNCLNCSLRKLLFLNINVLCSMCCTLIWSFRFLYIVLIYIVFGRTKVNGHQYSAWIYFEKKEDSMSPLSVLIRHAAFSYSCYTLILGFF